MIENMPKKRKIVIALGGNALGVTLKEQKAAVKVTAKAIADLIEDGCQVIICHGNGPQVGMIDMAFDSAARLDPKLQHIPMSVCVAMSQGYIGYDLQCFLREELLDRGLSIPVATVITQVVVDQDDPSFLTPTKPIGSFMTKEEADVLAAEGIAVAEDAGRGYRRVVASPKPVDIIEKATIAALSDAGHVVIAGGGGGIPVMRGGNALKGAAAVVDKDFTSAKLAEVLGADFLIILTAVEKVAINYGRPDVKWLDALSPEQAREYIAQGQFPKGSMLPKVQAALMFAGSKPGRKALITLLEKARDGIAGRTGTVIG